MKLYHFYQSTASYRIRIALNYKKINCELIAVDLLKQEQLTQKYLQINPHGRVPALSDGDFSFGESSAILEYLEDKYPERPLLPNTIKDRAWVRYLSQIIISDMHPVMNNSSVVRYLREELKLNEEQVANWYHKWLKQGFDALESNLRDKPERIFCYGDSPTFADVCLIPQIYNAHRFYFSMDQYPTLMNIYGHCTLLPDFEQAHPMHCS